MAIELYPHNQQTYRKMVEMFQTSNRVGIVQPTGTGKSFLILKWKEKHSRDSFIILSSSAEIFKQFSDYATSTGDQALLYSAQMITYQSLLKMTDEEIQSLRAQKIVVDEFHRAGAEQWGPALMKLLAANPAAQVLGTSATPVRYLDNSRDMAYELFDRNLAVEMSLGEAVAKGILPTPTYVPVWYDYDDKLKQYQEDIALVTDPQEREELERTLKQLKNNLQNSYGAEDVFVKYMPDNHGKYIVFCRDHKHLQEMQGAMRQWLSKVNSNVHSYVSISREIDRDAHLEAFKNDNNEDAIKLLFTIDRLNEGLHVKGIDGVIMLRPTTSPIIYLQQMGRALASGAKSPIVFDMVNNYRNLYITSSKGESIFRDFHPTIPPEQGLPAEFSEPFQIFSQMATFTELFADLESSLYLDYNSRWQKNYELLKEFIDTYMRYPLTKEYYKGTNLGVWLYNQKEAYKTGQLSFERERLLREIGVNFEQSVSEEQWQNNYALLKEFVEEHNNLPLATKTYQGVNIGKWLANQKQDYKKGRLSSERERLLRDLGVDFGQSQQDIWEEQWQSKYELLKKFNEEHNQFPAQTETYNGVKIGAWLDNQKTAFKSGKLSHERESLLCALGINFKRSQQDIWEEQWQKSYELLKEFVKKNNQLPSARRIFKGENLGAWLYNQKKMYNADKLAPEREQLLRALGVEFKPQIIQQGKLSLDEKIAEAEGCKRLGSSDCLNQEKAKGIRPEEPGDR